jgi:hypothetical protein
METLLERLPEDWAAWTLENMAQNVQPHVVARILRQKFQSLQIDDDSLEALRSSPIVASVRLANSRAQRREKLLMSRLEMRVVGRETRVDVRENLSASEFYARYFALSEPVLLSGAAKSWPAVEKWTFQALRQQFADAEVDVQGGRNSNPNYEIEIEQHRARMRFGDFIDAIADSHSNDLYMVANNHALESGLKPLINDIRAIRGVTNPPEPDGRTFIWIGAGGSVTPLHYDESNVMFVQVVGRKRFALAPFEAYPFMYNHVGVFSEARSPDADRQRFPNLSGVSFAWIDVEPGDVLFIPLGWWHYVTSFEQSISVSCTSFTRRHRSASSPE